MKTFRVALAAFALSTGYIAVAIANGFWVPAATENRALLCLVVVGLAVVLKPGNGLRVAR